MNSRLRTNSLKVTNSSGFLAQLVEPVPIHSIVVFRFTFGLMLAWEACRYLLNDWVATDLTNPPFHFTYPGFQWVQPLPLTGMLVLFLMLGISAICMALGLFYRLSIMVLWVGWTYIFLIDQALYLNHLYLVCLLAFLMMLVPANCFWSFDARRNGQIRSDTIPRWCLWMLRAQLAIPYLFGGIAKLDADWLSGYALYLGMQHMELARNLLPGFGSLDWARTLAWGGLWFDLFIVPALLWKRTRPFAFAIAVCFHLSNAFLFPIGIFPWMMICATTLFLEPDWPCRFWSCSKESRRGESRTRESHPGELSRDQSQNPSAEFPSLSPRNNRLIFGFLVIWFAIQSALPFRYLMYPGNVNWTERGEKFAWRMMLNQKTAAFQLIAEDLDSQEINPIDPRFFLGTSRQVDKLGQNPEFLCQFSRHVAELIRSTTGRNVAVRGLVFCSLNGRRPQLLVSPKADLAQGDSEKHGDAWIKPLVEPLPIKPFQLPPSQWSRLNLDQEGWLRK